MTTTSQGLLGQVRGELAGEVVGPEDDGYDSARTVFLGDIDRRPLLVARPVDAQDVARVVRAAATSGVDLAVRGGGHSSAGYGVSDGGIVLDMSAMRGIEIDTETRTAWAEAGLTAGEYSTAVGAHGLATGFGDVGSVGIAGITLGGGVGYLTRKHGMTVDSLLAAEVVTADGELRLVDAEHEPDLFWAIRGGGGNFGVVTRLRFRLHEVPGVVGGMILLPATPDVVAGFLAEADAAPEELSTIASVMPAPPLPFIPAELHGELVVMALVCYAGDPTEAEPVLQRFRDLATPLAYLVRPMPYAEMFPPQDESYRPMAVGRTLYADSVDRDTAAAVIDRVRTGTGSMRAVQLRVLGGAVARVAPEATAYAHRRSRILVNVGAFYDSPDGRPDSLAWAEGTAALLAGDDPGAYVNFLGDEGPERVRAAYPDPVWDRLVAVKDRYDPTNLFRLNQNVPPSAVAPVGEL